MKKSIFEYLKELKKKPYGKAVFFFGFYLIFFIFVFILISIGPKKNTNYENNSISNNSIVSLKSVLTKNYSFTYNVTLDDTNYSYIGDKDNDNIRYKYNDKEYFQNTNNSYVKEEDWKVVDNPIKFKYLFDENNINKLVEASYYESKTNYESGKVIYNFLISSNTINKIIDNTDTDYSEEPNKISIVKDNDITEIAFYLNSYCINNKLCSKNLKISINYDNYNGIKNMENPIEK